jgi:hypothetical protein
MLGTGYLPIFPGSLRPVLAKLASVLIYKINQKQKYWGHGSSSRALEDLISIPITVKTSIDIPIHSDTYLKST